MTGVTEELRRMRLVPVVVIQDPLQAPPLARALMEGGIPCAEITFRTSGAAEAIRRIVGECEGVLVGAGTVLTVEQAALAREAGARFVVSPGLSGRVVDYCQEHGIPVYPGVSTPTELQNALEIGLDTLKFFPAEPMGGSGFLKAISAPFAGVQFIPTGGIGRDQLPDYLRLENVVACGGSWITPKHWVEAGAFDRIRAEAADAVEIVRQTTPEDRVPEPGVDVR